LQICGCLPDIVKLNGLIREEEVTAFARGVRLKRGDLAQPVSVKRLEDRGKYRWLEIVLTEGKNREVRRTKVRRDKPFRHR
jgi:16S rRNA U516 pseudouridylate synthase RsuA-like enzyme